MFVVRWKTIVAAASEREIKAGPFGSREAAEKFAIRLASSMYDLLELVIEPIATDKGPAIT